MKCNKHISLLITAVLISAVAFSQHSHSRGGNPLYWGLVGAIAAGFYYVLSLVWNRITNKKSSKTKGIDGGKKRELYTPKNKIEISPLPNQENNNKSLNMDDPSNGMIECDKSVDGVHNKAFSNNRTGHNLRKKGKRKKRLLLRIVLGVVLLVSLFVIGILIYWNWYFPRHCQTLYNEGMNNYEISDSIFFELRKCNFLSSFDEGSKGFALIQNSAERGNERSQVLLGRYYKYYYDYFDDYDFFKPYIRDWKWRRFYKFKDYETWRSIRSKWDKAAYWFLQAAKNGNPEAQSELGHCYKYGIGVEQNFDKAIYWIKLGADNGDAVAQWRMGNIYRWGLDYYDGNWSGKYWWDGYGWIEVEGNPTEYVEGKKVNNKKILETFLSRDINKAKYYWRLASQQGLQEAKDCLEKIYE